MSDTIEGGCLCGAVRYRAMSEPFACSLCHCRTCRLASGAPSVAWVVFHSNDFAFIGEEPSSFHSSPGVVRTFCGRCGTPLTYRHTSEPERIDVTTVTLERPDDFAPTKEIWIEHKVAWECLNDKLEHYPRSSAGGAGVAA